jgi:hypothetical protein
VPGVAQVCVAEKETIMRLYELWGICIHANVLQYARVVHEQRVPMR